jgi:hypothetical protein
MKPPDLDLMGRGALAPVWSYGQAHALAGSHPCSTQILTRHFSAQSQTVGQLTELGDYVI